MDTGFKGFFCYGWGWWELCLLHISLQGCLYFNPHFSSPIHLQRCSTPDGVRGLCERTQEVWVRNGRMNLARQSNFHKTAGFFDMLQSCDMGQTALLPLWRKACWGFLRPKNLTALARFEPAIFDTKSKVYMWTRYCTCTSLKLTFI
jgi:hypothetical protein